MQRCVIAVVTLAGIWQGSWMFCMSPLQGQGHVQGCPWGGGGAGLTTHKGLLLLKKLWVICCTCHLPDQRHTAMYQSSNQLTFPSDMCYCMCQSSWVCACADTSPHVLVSSSCTNMSCASMCVSPEHVLCFAVIPNQRIAAAGDLITVPRRAHPQGISFIPSC